MRIRFSCLILISSFFLTAVNGREITADEIASYALEKYRIDYFKAPLSTKDSIAKEYNELILLSERVMQLLDNDKEYIRYKETKALELWSRNIVQNTPILDEQLKELYTKQEYTISTRYKLRELMTNNESQAQEIISQLNLLSKEQRLDKFKNLSQNYPLIPSVMKDNDLGWNDISTLSPERIQSLKEAKKGDVVLVKLQGAYQILFVEEMIPEHKATWDEAKETLSTIIRQQNLTLEAKKLLNTPMKEKKTQKKSKKRRNNTTDD